MPKIHVANPSDRTYTHSSFLLSMEPIGPTLVLAFADNLSDAIEEAAEYCADQGWVGIVTPHEDPDPVGDGSDPLACGDLLHTESGWLTSHEVMLFRENPEPAEIARIHRA